MNNQKTIPLDNNPVEQPLEVQPYLNKLKEVGDEQLNNIINTSADKNEIFAAQIILCRRNDLPQALNSNVAKGLKISGATLENKEESAKVQKFLEEFKNATDEDLLAVITDELSVNTTRKYAAWITFFIKEKNISSLLSQVKLQSKGKDPILTAAIKMEEENPSINNKTKGGSGLKVSKNTNIPDEILKSPEKCKKIEENLEKFKKAPTEELIKTVIRSLEPIERHAAKIALFLRYNLSQPLNKIYRTAKKQNSALVSIFTKEKDCKLPVGENEKMSLAA